MSATVSTATGLPDGGAPARRAMARWAWRLFRREWRQQLLVLSLIVVAVAVTVVGSAVAVDSHVPASNGFGTAHDMATFTGAGPQTTAEIDKLKARFGRVDIIEDETLPVPGSVGSYQLRSQDPYGPFGRPMLSLLSGRYPVAAGETALTPTLAAGLGLKLGSTWHEGGRALRVVGLVQDPENTTDQFALVPPGQVSSPTQVTVLFDAPGVVPQSIAPNVQTPATAASSANNLLSEIVVYGGLAMGMLLIGLVSVGGFTVLAQRRMRSLGMLASLGATEDNISLVVKANGAVVGVVGAVTGVVLGLLAWVAYRPSFQATAHRAIGLWAVPWPAVGAAVVLAVVAAYLAASRPARSVARVPVLAALSGRPAPPAKVHRSALPGLACLVAAFFLTSLGASQVKEGQGGGGGASLTVLGLVLLVPAMVLLAPLFLSLLGRAARVAPATVRLAWRDLARYRSRSSSALGAVSLAVLIAVVICVVAQARYANPFDYTGPNLAGDQLVVYTPAASPHAPGTAQPASTPAEVRKTAYAIAGLLGSHEVLQLETTNASLFHRGSNWVGSIYVATSQLLAALHIRPSDVSPRADILTVRPGLAGVAGMELVGHYVATSVPGSETAPRPACTRAGCIDRPVVQQLAGLPSGTSAPNTLITLRAVRKLGLEPTVAGWLVQAPSTVTPAQVTSARLMAAGQGMSVESRDDVPTMSSLLDAATASGTGLALAVLAMSVGLVRSETAGDLQILAVTGASGRARRAISAATAGGLALLGALIGTIAGYVGVIGFLRGASVNGGVSSLANVPMANLLMILLGMPAVAVALGWLLSGRESPAKARSCIE